MLTWMSSESCDPAIDALVADRVSSPCFHVTGVAPICVDEDDATVLVDDDAFSGADRVVELAPFAGAVLVAKIPAFGPNAELTTYVPLAP